VFGTGRQELERLTREVLSIRYASHPTATPNAKTTSVANSPTPDAEVTSVCAGQRLCGAPRRNRTGDPILTMEPPGTAVRMIVFPGRARPSGPKLSALSTRSYALSPCIKRLLRPRRSLSPGATSLQCRMLCTCPSACHHPQGGVQGGGRRADAASEAASWSPHLPLAPAASAISPAGCSLAVRMCRKPGSGGPANAGLRQSVVMADEGGLTG
jgi:hypothetical protein